MRDLSVKIVTDSEDLDRLFKIELMSIKDEDSSEYQMMLFHESYL